MPHDISPCNKGNAFVSLLSAVRQRHPDRVCSRYRPKMQSHQRKNGARGSIHYWSHSSPAYHQLPTNHNHINIQIHSKLVSFDFFSHYTNKFCSSVKSQQSCLCPSAASRAAKYSNTPLPFITDHRTLSTDQKQKRSLVRSTSKSASPSSK